MFLVRRNVNPCNEMSRFQQEMNRVLNGVFGDDSPFVSAATQRYAVAWPKLDISETENTVHISGELPGLKQDEIEIEVLANTLHISGEKKDERVVDKHRFHSVERSFGRFDRTVPLPVDVDGTKAEATFKDGVLSIELPKVKPVSAQKIAVKTAQ